MDLTYFPMDRQKCFLTFESFNYNTEEVKMRWIDTDDPVLLLKEIRLPDFDLTDRNASRKEEVSNSLG